MKRANVRWITDALSRENQILLGLLDGEHPSINSFLTPYQIEIPSEVPLTILQKYVFPKGELTEYFYDIEGSKKRVDEIVSKIKKLSYPVLSFTYMIPDPQKGLRSDDVNAVLPIIKALVDKLLFQKSGETFIESGIDKVVYELYKNPNYIVFTPMQKQLLSSEYDMLKEYRAHLSNPLGTLNKYSYFPPIDEGNQNISPVYVSEDVLADLRSKIRIDEFMGYALLYHNTMPYHILEEWAYEHDYDENTILENLKKVGPEKDVVIIKHDLVLRDPESIFWDLKSRSQVKESRGWFIVKLDEVYLARNLSDIYLEIAKAFNFQTHKDLNVPNEILFKPTEDREYFGFDVREWLSRSLENIFLDIPLTIRISGDWNMMDNIPLTAETYSKVWYAAYRGFQKLLNINPEIVKFNKLIKVYPDLSIEMVVYNIEEAEIVKEEVEGILSEPQNVQVVLCKTLAECIASRANTKELIPNSIPFSIYVGGEHILASNSRLELILKPADFPEEAHQKDLDPTDPHVQGFLPLGSIKGNLPELKEPQKIEDVIIQIIEFKGRVYTIALLAPDRSIDLFSIPVSKTKSKSRFVQEIEQYTNKLWKNGWFFTNWGKNLYLQNKIYSNHLLKDISSEIKTFSDLKKIASTYP